MNKKEKPIFSTLLEHDASMTTVPVNDIKETDHYQHTYDITRLRQLLNHTIEEFNKVHPNIHIALCRVSILIRKYSVVKDFNSLCKLHLP